MLVSQTSHPQPQKYEEAVARGNSHGLDSCVSPWGGSPLIAGKTYGRIGTGVRWVGSQSVLEPFPRSFAAKEQPDATDLVLTPAEVSVSLATDADLNELHVQHVQPIPGLPVSFERRWAA